LCKNGSGDINKRLVQTTMQALLREKLVEMRRERYSLTKAGEKVAPAGWQPNQSEMAWDI
jgi:hypothetical protein